MRREITRVLQADPDMAVVDTATDGLHALEKLEHNHYHVVILDIEMPRLNGLNTLRRIMVTHPLPVIIFTGKGHQHNAIRALKFGAIDFLQKPEASAENSAEFLRHYLLEKVKTAAQLDMTTVVNILQSRMQTVDLQRISGLSTQKIEVVAIGASTGGPVAVDFLLASLKRNFPFAILATLHMPPVFTAAFAEQLAKETTGIPIQEAKFGERIEPGRIYLCPGHSNLRIATDNGEKRILLERMGRQQAYPSITKLFDSVAVEYGPNAVGIILTGMGNDGTKGLQKLHRAGGYVIAQDHKSSVSFGMPGSAIDAGCVDNVMSLGEISSFLNSIR